MKRDCRSHPFWVEPCEAWLDDNDDMYQPYKCPVRILWGEGIGENMFIADAIGDTKAEAEIKARAIGEAIVSTLNNRRAGQRMLVGVAGVFAKVFFGYHYFPDAEVDLDHANRSSP